MKVLTRLGALLVFSATTYAVAQDALQKFLKDNQLSNVPYIEQGKPEPGGFVVFDTNKPHDRPSWFKPVSTQEELKTVIVDPDGDINIPSNDFKHMKDGGFEMSLFGFSPLGQIQSTGTLEYDQINMKVHKVTDPNAFYNGLLKRGAPLDKEVLAYGKGATRLYGNQHFYVILGVYSTDALKIKSTGGTIVGFSTGSKIAKCPNIAGAPPKDDATGTTTTKAVTDSGGMFRYCQRDEQTVELHSSTGKPVQIGVQLARVTPDDPDKWILDQKVVVFAANRTKE